MNARHHVPFAVVRSQDLHVARWKTGIEQALGHGVCGNRGAADGIGGVDFNQLLENVARKLLGAVVHLSVQRTSTEKARDHRERKQSPKFQVVLSQDRNKRA